ncbi:peptidoglycan-binding domain-containing protein [Novispirillum sp. DQ9]|uniref:peptidoglycan-binding domain-containing protein n=1 Tax=Novispirillum sp. DQ9 TaxID=3398612 RepID=UPI003C7D7F02
MRLWMIAPLGLALIAAACGRTEEQRAASGGLGGAAAGAVVGGPVGAVVGGAAGAAGGMMRDDAEQAIDEARAEEGGGSGASAQISRTTGEATDQEVRGAQQALRDMGLYDGQIDGIAGPRTRSAVEQYQQRQGLPQTASLDDRTLDSLRQQSAGAFQGRQSQDRMDQQQMGQRPMPRERMDDDRMRRDDMRMQQPTAPAPTTGTTVR